MWHHIETPATNREEQKGKLKSNFSSLTEADLNYKEEGKNEMLCNMRVKLAKTKLQLNAFISYY